MAGVEPRETSGEPAWRYSVQRDAALLAASAGRTIQLCVRARRCGVAVRTRESGIGSRFEFQSSKPIAPRACDCSFCRKHGIRSVSDPDGLAVIRTASGLEPIRYRFGLKTADFLICPVCGTYVATLMEGSRGPVGVVNVVGLAIAELEDQPATLASLEGESPEERIRRRLSRWTPMTLEEPAS